MTEVTNQTSPRGRGNPQPLRVNQGASFQSSRGARLGDQQQSTDKDFVYPQPPPGSSQSARPGTQGGQSQGGRSARSHGSLAGTSRRFTPRKEQTVVGVGTHGLGSRGKEIHASMRTAIFDDWCRVKDEQRAQARSPEMAQAREAAAQPLSPEQRQGDRRYKSETKKRTQDYHNDRKADQFRKVRAEIDNENQQQKKESQDFVTSYSEDNVKAARQQIQAQQRYREDLKLQALPALAPMRKAVREEKARWTQQQHEEEAKWEDEKAARREYILEMKRISKQNMVEEMEDKRILVENHKKWLLEKEVMRKEEAEDLKKKRAIDAKEDREKLVADIRKVKYKRWNAMEKEIRNVKAEDEKVKAPILQDREAFLNAKKEVVKERYVAQKTPRGNSGDGSNDSWFDGSRKQFFEDRRAAADDIRLERARNSSNVRQEKEETLIHKHQQYEEGVRASQKRVDKQRTRPGSRSPVRTSPREAW